MIAAVPTRDDARAAPVLPEPPSRASVLIVDDSAVARAVIARVVDDSDRFRVAGTAGDVPGALQFLRGATVDLILLDINLPGVDGITALPDLIAAGGRAKVLIVSTAVADGAAQTLQALAFGAADTLVKPEAGALSGRFAVSLIEKLNRLYETGPALVSAPIPSHPASRPRPTSDQYDIVAIGASTGGIHALSHLLRELPASFSLPVLVTQHLPTSFMPYFAAQLALLAGRPCEVAVDRLRVRPGRLIVAAGDSHMTVVPLTEGGAAIRLVQTPAATGCMPSVDAMLSSVAITYGARALGVVLSGMGKDGAEGARSLRAAGGAVVVQDQASSVIWGMPGAVVAQGGADAMLPPDAIGQLIAHRRRP